MSKQRLLQTVFMLSSVLLAYGGYRLYPRTMPIYNVARTEFPVHGIYFYNSGEPATMQVFECPGADACRVIGKEDSTWNGIWMKTAQSGDWYCHRVGSNYWKCMVNP